MGLVAFQVLLGIGGYILQGKMHSKIITIPYLGLAKLIGKKNGTVWRGLLSQALLSLEHAGILSGFHMGEGGAEVHIENRYLDQICGNPWFVRSTEIHGRSPLAVFLRWWLCFLPNRRDYSIEMAKLAGHLQSDDTNIHRFAARVVEAAKEIPWVTKTEYREARLIVKMKRHSTAPIAPLRKRLSEQITEGK
jgi:hypothetical protein